MSRNLTTVNEHATGMLPVPADGDYSRQLRDFIELWSEDAPPHEVKSDD